MVGVRVVPAHRVPCPRDNFDLDVVVAELGQSLAGLGRDEDSLLPATGDHEGRPGNGGPVVDPWCLAGDLVPVCQRRVELRLGRCPWPELDLGPQRELDPAPGRGPLTVVTEALDRLREGFRRWWPFTSSRHGGPRRILQHACADKIGPGHQNRPGHTRPHGVTNQERGFAPLVDKRFQQGDHVSDHVLEPVTSAGGRVEAGRLAVSASVWRDDAIVVTPAAHRVRPAQT